MEYWNNGVREMAVILRSEAGDDLLSFCNFQFMEATKDLWVTCDV
jgi:hypothetical protein